MTNIISEVAILAQAILLIIRIKTNFQKKFILASVFSFRVLWVASPHSSRSVTDSSSVIGAIACQIAFLNESTGSEDPTFDTASATIAMEFTQAFSIVTACAPQLKPFLDSLQSTGMRLNGMTGSYAKGSGSNSYGRSGRGGHSKNSRPIELQEGNHTVITAKGDDWEIDSQSSRTQIIRETRTWTVTDAPRSPEDESLLR